MKVALAVVKRALAGAADLVAATEAEIAARRREAEARGGEANECGHAWLFAASQSEAEELARRRAEALRLVQRAEAELPDLEARLAAAKAERQRQALSGHRSELAALYPKLRRAIEEAARVQVEAIAAREAAVAELGEHAVTFIPPIAYRGLLLGDLVKLWADEQDRVWAAPRPQAVAAVPPAPAKLCNGSNPGPRPPAPRPARVPRRDAAPGAGQTAILFIRSGLELPDGSLAVTGDRVNLPADQAHALVLQGAADFAEAAS